MEKRITSIMKDKFRLDKTGKITIKYGETDYKTVRRFKTYIKRNKERISFDDFKDSIKGLLWDLEYLVKVDNEKVPQRIAAIAKYLEKDAEKYVFIAKVRNLHYMSYLKKYTELNESLYFIINLKDNVPTNRQNKVNRVYNRVYNTETNSYTYPKQNEKDINPILFYTEINYSDLYAAGQIIKLLTPEDYVKIGENLEEAYIRNQMTNKNIKNYFNQIKQVDPKMIRYLNDQIRKAIIGSIKSQGLDVLLSLEVLKDKLLALYQKDLNYKRMEDYEKAQKSSYARAFQTKKNIPEKIKSRMKTSPFLKTGFKFVEYDADVDLNKLEIVEKHWTEIYNKLPKVDPAILRFRKLGNYKAYGVYFPTHHTMAVDLRHIISFLHEYGHLLDYTYKEEPLSLTEEFEPIIQKYSQNWYDLPKNTLIKDTNYYLTPTEIFARSFEIFLTMKGLKTHFLKPLGNYQKLEPYKVILEDQELLKDVLKYFEEVF